MALAIERRGTFAPTHHTTRLCLELLVGAAQSGLLKGRWLDVGSGSGVLAIACGRLGAELVVACDIDPRAARTTVANARINEQERRVLTFCGSTESLRGCFEGIVANLPIAVLASKRQSFARLLALGGILIVSGFREPEGEWLVASLEPMGFALQAVVTRHETSIELPPSGSFTWAGLRLERRKLAETAEGILTKELGPSEAESFKFIQKKSQKESKNVGEVARQVIEFFGPPGDRKKTS